MELRILSEADVRSAIDMRGAISAMREAFTALSGGDARVPMRLPLESDGGVTLLMPAYLPAAGGLAAKVVSVFDDNPRRGLPAISALVLVLDPETGRPRAVMNGTYLTALRTGAASGLATELLARDDARVLAVFGAGAQARTQIQAVREVRPIREVRIVARSRESAERLAAGLDGVEARPVEDRAAAVAGADVIVAATNSSVPVFDGTAVEPGTHVNGIGSYTPEMQEVDSALVRRATVVVDEREAALAETGDFAVPIREGEFSPDQIHAELGEIAAGERPGRRSADEITFFKSVGNAIQDVAVAGRILETAEARGVGTVVEL